MAIDTGIGIGDQPELIVAVMTERYGQLRVTSHDGLIDVNGITIPEATFDAKAREIVGADWRERAPQIDPEILFTRSEMQPYLAMLDLRLALQTEEPGEGSQGKIDPTQPYQPVANGSSLMGPMEFSEFEGLSAEPAMAMGLFDGEGYSIEIRDTEAVESDDYIEFPVVFSVPATNSATVDWSVSNGTATHGSDYGGSTSGSFSITPGDRGATIRIPLIEDSTVEGFETLTATLDDIHQVGAEGYIADDDATGTIIDNDEPGSNSGLAAFSISDASAQEGNTGQSNALTFTVTRTGDVSVAASVSWSSQDGTAKKEVDYWSASGSVAFSANETSKTITIHTRGDNSFEPDEDMYVILSSPTPSGSVILDRKGKGIIRNDDPNTSVKNATNNPQICFCDCGCSTGNAATSVDKSTGVAQIQLSLPGIASLLHTGSMADMTSVAVDFSFGTSYGSASYYVARLTFDGVAQDPVYFSGHDTGDLDLRFLVPVANASTLATGTYDWSMEIEAVFASGTALVQSAGKKTVSAYNTASEFGDGWSIAGLSRLVVAGNGDVTYLNGHGSAAYFQNNQDRTVGHHDATFTTPLGYFDELVETDDGGFRMWHTDGSYDLYDEDGLLTSQVDRHGNTTTFDYDSGKLELITDPFGRETQFHYNSGRVDKITDFAGRETSLDYSGGRLETVTLPDPDGPLGAQPAQSIVIQYDPVTHRLVQYDQDAYVDEYDVVHTRSVFLTYHPQSGALATLKYGADGVPFAGAPRQYVPYDLPSYGGADVYTRAAILPALLRTGEWTDALGRTSTFTLDRFGNITSWTDPLGHTTTYSRYDNGLLQTLTLPDPDGEGVELVSKPT